MLPRRTACISLIAMLSTAACSQAPAPIAMKGQNNYGRSGESYAVASNAYMSGNSYSSLQPAAGGNAIYNVPQATVQAAPAPSIGVSDLPPPRSPEAIPARVNPWTGPVTSNAPKDESFNLRPASKTPVREQMVSEVAPVKELPVAQPDSSMAVQKAEAPKTRVDGFMWPTASRRVISTFGPKGKGKVNDGINIAAGNGEPVWAAADGEVVYTGNELQGYGNMVLIKHAGGKSTAYAHLSQSIVDKYQRVKQGDIIGYVGATGNAKKPQLHFALRDGKEPLDPQKHLVTKVAGL